MEYSGPESLLEINLYEIVAAVCLLAITSLVATNSSIQLPAAATSPIVGVVLVILGLGIFPYSPVVAIALLLLVAVLFFKQNVATTVRSSVSQYADVTVPDQSMSAATEYSSTKSDPRSYAQFQETDPMNRMYGSVEGFSPAPIAEGEPVDGQYPTQDPRVTSPTVASEYNYRPSDDTGSNEFQRFGPQLDEKKQSFTYYQ